MTSPLDTLRERLEELRTIQIDKNGLVGWSTVFSILDTFTAEWRCETCIHDSYCSKAVHYRTPLRGVLLDFCSKWEVAP